MDLWQLRHWLYRRRRKTHTEIRRWIQLWPPQFRRIVMAVWPALRLVARVSTTGVQTLILCIAAPWVLLADLFRRGKRVEHRWLVYIAMLAICLTAGNWSLTRVVNQRYQHSLTTLERYLQYTQDASTVGNVPFSEIINRHALSNRIDPALLAAVIACESSFNPDAVSSAGARGLMQIMPGTWSDLNPHAPCRGDHLPPSEGSGCIFDPEANISSGSRYLRELLDEFDDNAVTALAAYNAGRGTVTHYAITTGELPPIAETRVYLQNVTNVWSGLRSGTGFGSLWQPELLRLWQDRLNIASMLLWTIAGAWALIKNPTSKEPSRGIPWQRD